MNQDNQAHKAMVLKETWFDKNPIDKCEEMGDFQKEFSLSERKLAEIFKLSKSQVHRMLMVSRLPYDLRVAHLKFKTDYYTLCLYAELGESQVKNELGTLISQGLITKHVAAKRFVKNKMGEVKQEPRRIFFDGRTGNINCSTCGKSESMNNFLPCDVTQFTKIIDEWSKPHKNCKGETK